MRKIILFSIIFFVLLLQNTYSQNAPVTYAPHITCDSATTIDIPITVTDFNNIGALSLKLQFDASVLDYQSYTNNSNFPGLLIFEQTTGEITAGGVIFFGPGISLSDNSILFTLTFDCIGGSTELLWFDNGISCEYSDDQFNPLNDSPTCSYYKNGSINESSIQLGLDLYLEGAFMNGEMTTQLKDLNLVPTSQPYTGSPWNYDGIETVSSIPEDVVDWILVELRESTGDASTATADKSIARQAGFLLKDGSIINANECSFGDLKFSVSLNDNLYVVVYHRNHIAVITADPLTIINETGNYNFSSGEALALGGSLGHKELSTGVWGLAAGDSNADGIINELDKQNDFDQSAGTMGYLNADFSMDSQNNNIDKNDFWYLNFGFTSRVP